MKEFLTSRGLLFHLLSFLFASYIITGPIPTFLERLIILLKERINPGYGEAFLNVVRYTIGSLRHGDLKTV